LEFDKKDILSQTILLNWLRQWTGLYDMGKEEQFEKILKEFIKSQIRKDKIELIESIIEMVDIMMIGYDDGYDSDYIGNDNYRDGFDDATYKLYDKIDDLKKELDLLK